MLGSVYLNSGLNAQLHTQPAAFDAALKRARTFTWERTGRLTLDAYRAAGERIGAMPTTEARLLPKAASAGGS